MTGCTIVDNSSGLDGSNVRCLAGAGSLVNCIIAFGEGGVGVYGEAESIPTLTCCDVYGHALGNYGGDLTDQTGLNNNIMEDPQLCGVNVEDYRLSDTSPCLAGESPCGVLIGALDVGCESPVEMRSWGTIKAMYR